MKFKDLIGNIEKRPRGYLRNDSVTELYVLLQGFSLSDHEKDAEETDFFQHFNKFVNLYYSFQDTNFSWPYLLLLNTGGSECAALNNFFAIYHDFVSKYSSNKEQAINNPTSESTSHKG